MLLIVRQFLVGISLRVLDAPDPFPGKIISQVHFPYGLSTLFDFFDRRHLGFCLALFVETNDARSLVLRVTLALVEPDVGDTPEVMDTCRLASLALQKSSPAPCKNLAGASRGRLF